MSASPQTARKDELVAMLAMISSQVQATLDETNAPAALLVDTAHTVGGAAQTVARCLFELSGSPALMFEELVTLQSNLHERSGNAATAVQFHDRLVQSLSHVCTSLTYLAEFLQRNEGRTGAPDWSDLHARIRSVFSMERERMVFDLSNRGAPSAEINQAVATSQASSAGSVELF
jgi:hypothetical protein